MRPLNSGVRTPNRSSERAMCNGVLIWDAVHVAASMPRRTKVSARSPSRLSSLVANRVVLGLPPPTRRGPHCGGRRSSAIRPGKSHRSLLARARSSCCGGRASCPSGHPLPFRPNRLGVVAPLRQRLHHRAMQLGKDSPLGPLVHTSSVGRTRSQCSWMRRSAVVLTTRWNGSDR